MRHWTRIGVWNVLDDGAAPGAGVGHQRSIERFMRRNRDAGTSARARRAADPRRAEPERLDELIERLHEIAFRTDRLERHRPRIAPRMPRLPGEAQRLRSTSARSCRMSSVSHSFTVRFANCSVGASRAASRPLVTACRSRTASVARAARVSALQIHGLNRVPTPARPATSGPRRLRCCNRRGS